MRVYLKRTLTGFVPADEASTEAVRGYRLGEVFKADIVKPRNYQHHKLAVSEATWPGL